MEEVKKGRRNCDKSNDHTLWPGVHKAKCVGLEPNPKRILMVLRRLKIIVRETSAIARCGITETSGYSQTNIRDYIVKFIIRIETNQTLIMTLLNTPEQPKIKAVAKMINRKWATFGFLRWNWIDNLVFGNLSLSMDVQQCSFVNLTRRMSTQNWFWWLKPSLTYFSNISESPDLYCSVNIPRHKKTM